MPLSQNRKGDRLELDGGRFRIEAGPALKRANVERPNTSKRRSFEPCVDLVSEEFVTNGRTILE